METKKLTCCDLMVGDLVSIDNKLHKVTGIQICDGIMCVQTDYTDTYYSIENYEPIPLSAAILKKIGFVKGLWGTYRLPNTTFAVDIDAYGLMFLRFSNCQICEIKSVSHLQHLMRDLGINKEIVL